MLSSLDPKIKKIIGEVSHSLDLLTDQFPISIDLSGILKIPTKEEATKIIQLLKPVLLPYSDSSNSINKTSSSNTENFITEFTKSLEELTVKALKISYHEKKEEIELPALKEISHIKIADFLKKIPSIKSFLIGDIEKAFASDPSVYYYSEIIASYPCVLSMFHHRIAHELYKLEIPIIPRLISESAHSLTGIDIHPGARIGKRFFIDHGTGVVIGETAIVGDDVTLFQGVTLGVKSFPTDSNDQIIKGLKRHPILENNVTVYSGASILGRITVGEGSMIGGNIWLTNSVPKNSKIIQTKPRNIAFEYGAGI